MLVTALDNNSDINYVGRQAGDWAALYRQLDALMQAAWELNEAAEAKRKLNEQWMRAVGGSLFQ